MVKGFWGLGVWGSWGLGVWSLRLLWLRALRAFGVSGRLGLQALSPKP